MASKFDRDDPLSQVLNVLSANSGALSLPSLGQQTQNMPQTVVARTLKSAAVKGLVELKGDEVRLTPFGHRLTTRD